MYVCFTDHYGGNETMTTLLELRQAKHWTKKEVAAKTGVSTYKLTQYEQGQHKNLYALDFVLLANAYGVKPSDIQVNMR